MLSRFFERLLVSGSAIVALVLMSPVLAGIAPDPRCLNLVQPELALPPGAADLPDAIIFVTQMPLSDDLENRYTTFGNHRGRMSAAGRGGDLWMLNPPDPATFPQGCLRNLTREAGFGETGELQTGEAPIAVREPSVHWNGERVLFSMVQGAPSEIGNPRYYWQIYEATGIGFGESLEIKRLEGQPAGFNNVSPIYSADDDIVYFTSDQPRDGATLGHLYPQQDEYERNETVSGLWELKRSAETNRLLTHNPSGVFSPMLDSSGRIIVSRWDHLQRDIFAANAFQWSSEAADATVIEYQEHFPEPLPSETAPPTIPRYGRVVPYNFKHFFLWQLQADGSGEEILNHLGRHELVHYFDRNFDLSGNGLASYTNPRPRTETIENMLHPEEDPTRPHRYVFVDAPHFKKQSSGRLMYVDAEPDVSPDVLKLVPLTAPGGTRPGEPQYDGDRFRDPLPMSDGSLLASHANPCSGDPTCSDDTKDADPDAEAYSPNYRFRLRWLTPSISSPYLQASEAVTPDIRRTLRMFGVRQGGAIQFDGSMSQIDAVAVRIRERPPVTEQVPLPPAEMQVFLEEEVDLDEFQSDLRERQLALMVVRDATTRDQHDRQQPFNLQVANSTHGSITPSGQIFTIKDLQLFQGDLISGYEYRSGRRVQAMPLHDIPLGTNPSDKTGSENPKSVRPISTADGSVAALVPANRALTWQLNDPQGIPVVRERYWINFQPGEVRVCTSCHGLNQTDQLDRPAPQQPPEALRELLRWWKLGATRIFADGFDDAS